MLSILWKNRDADREKKMSEIKKIQYCTKCGKKSTAEYEIGRAHV